MKYIDKTNDKAGFLKFVEDGSSPVLPPLSPSRLRFYEICAQAVDVQEEDYRSFDKATDKKIPVSLLTAPFVLDKTSAPKESFSLSADLHEILVPHLLNENQRINAAVRQHLSNIPKNQYWPSVADLIALKKARAPFFDAGVLCQYNEQPRPGSSPDISRDVVKNLKLLMSKGSILSNIVHLNDNRLAAVYTDTLKREEVVESGYDWRRVVRLTEPCSALRIFDTRSQQCVQEFILQDHYKTSYSSIKETPALGGRKIFAKLSMLPDGRLGLLHRSERPFRRSVPGEEGLRPVWKNSRIDDFYGIPVDNRTIFFFPDHLPDDMRLYAFRPTSEQELHERVAQRHRDRVKDVTYKFIGAVGVGVVLKKLASLCS